MWRKGGPFGVKNPSRPGRSASFSVEPPPPTNLQG
jgi:hypothetical protein